jgi:hypothetical protein
MRRRFSLGRALAFATLLSLPAVACTDDPPTATGGNLFPGNLPSTFQVVLPADSFFQQLGSFSGFSDAGDVGYQIVANGFDGSLQANTLVKLAAFPTSFNYTQGGTARSDTLATLGRGSLVARVDTAASTSTGPIQLQLWEVGQAWDPATVSWTMAVDTAGGRVRWTQPGGSRAALLSSVSLAAGARPTGDSVVFALDSLTVQRIARPGFPGLLITATGAPGRVQLQGGTYQLRTGAHPRSASPDTVLAVNVSAAVTSFIFDPDQPSPPARVIQVGGIRSARTLLRVNLPRTLAVCQGATCTRVATRDVTLNEVSLLFTPTAVPGGYRPVGPVPIALRRVAEPELGRRAPLGQVVNEIIGLDPTARTPVYGGARFAPADSVLAVPLTSFATNLVASDTTSFSLALLSDPGTLSGNPGALSFGVAWFTPAPRLRIVYTLPARPALP